MLSSISSNLPNPAWGRYVTKYFRGEDIVEKQIATTTAPSGWADIDPTTTSVREWYESKGFTVRSGGMYGCDFVLYRGDPNLYHSEYCVHVTSHADSLSWLELQGLARLAEKVRKSLLICVFDSDSKAIFDFSPHRVDVPFDNAAAKRKSESDRKDLKHCKA